MTSTATRCARTGGRRRSDRRVRPAPDGLVRPVRPQRTRAARQHQLRHRARRLHAARPRVATTTSTTRPISRITATATTTTLAGTAASRDRPTTRRSSRCARARRATSSRRCCFSQGVPMLSAGDELAARSRATTTRIARTTRSRGWTGHSDDARTQLLAFVRRVVQLRRQHPVFRRRHFFEGRALQGDETKDIAWLKPDGTEMTEQEWNNDFARCLGVYLAGDCLGETDGRRREVTDDDFIVLFNAHDGPIRLHAAVDSTGGGGSCCSIRHATRGCRRTARTRVRASIPSRRERSCCCRRYRRHEARPRQCRSAPISAIAARPVSPVGAGCAQVGLVLGSADDPRGACRCRARRRLVRAQRRWRRRRRSLSRIASTTALPSRSGLALQSGRRARREASSSTRPRTSGTTEHGAAGRGTRPCVYELHVGTFTPAGTFAAGDRAASTIWSSSASPRSS